MKDIEINLHGWNNYPTKDEEEFVVSKAGM